MKTASVYEKIEANIGEDGKLPSTFLIEVEQKPGRLQFAPGMLDRMAVFSQESSKEEKVVKDMVRLLNRFCKAPQWQYLFDMELTLAGYQAISVFSPIMYHFCSKYGHRLGVKKILGAAFRITQESTSVELVKIGIGLFGLTDYWGTDKAIDSAEKVLSNLALYEEFTSYVVFAISSWAAGNRITFQIAQTVDGWGKIYAVEQLEPETEEIREWILREGCSNGVMDAYLGLECAVKGDLISALRQESLDDQLFNSVAIIINALLDEGPVSGISAYEHAKEALMLFLRHAQEHTHSINHLWRILQVQKWAEDAKVDYKDEVFAQCVEITQCACWQDKIISIVERHDDAFEFFCACKSADQLGIDISAALFDVVTADPIEYHSYIPQLFRSSERASEMILLCENVLPLEKLARGMGDYSFPDTLIQEYFCLDFILSELAAYPLQGVKLVQTGLNSPLVRNRNMACHALSGWVRAQKKPLVEISLELYSEVTRVCQIEVNEDTKDSLQKLLDGVFEDA